jgi:uncharacterized protein (DUF697 family)
MSDEVLSGLKVLVALAKADGVVHENERLAIENALDGIELDTTDGQGVQAAIDSLLATDVDLEKELARIKSPRVKQQTFDSACAIVYVDGEASDLERAMLEKVRAAFELGDQEAASLRFKAALHRAFAPLAQQADTEQSSRRDVAVEDEITRFALLGAALASLPLPSFCAGINLTNEVRLARKIATFYGHRGDASFWKTFVTNIVGAAGSWLAISALARLAGLGSRANGAYASAYALGKVTELYFEKQEAIEIDALRTAFKDAKKKGQSLAKDASAKIAEKTAEVEKAKRELDTLLLDEKISETEYEERLVVLA